MMKPGMRLPTGPVLSTMSTPSGAAGMAQRPLFSQQNQSLMGVSGGAPRPPMPMPSAQGAGMARPPQSLFAPRSPSQYNSTPSQGMAGQSGMPYGMGRPPPSFGGMGMARPPIQMGQASPPSSLRDVASMGRYGDSMLAHINPREAMMLKAAGGSGTVNPATGLREFWDFGGSGTDTLSSDGWGSDDSVPTATFDNPIDADFGGGGGETRGPYQPGFWESTLWGLGGTILTGNPLLGAAAAKFGPQAWNSFSSWASGLTPDKQAAAQKAVEDSLAGQKHISERNINDALAAAYEVGGGSDSGGSAPRVSSGRNIAYDPFWGPLFDPETRNHGWPDPRNPNWDTDPRNPASTGAPKVDPNKKQGTGPNDGPRPDIIDKIKKGRPVTPYKGDITKYGQNDGAHLFFDRWF